MLKGYIYKCTCVVSGKLYIGLTTKKSLEVKYVAFYDSFHNGYNLTPGGELTFRGEPKIVNMYNEDTGTIGHLAAKYKLDSSAICKVCNRQYKSTGKLDGKRLVFRYTYDEYTSLDKQKLEKNNKGFKSGKPIAGYSFDTGAELFRFNSATEAAKALNLDYRSISNCASGKYKYSGKIDNVKIVWKYLE